MFRVPPKDRKGTTPPSRMESMGAGAGSKACSGVVTALCITCHVDDAKVRGECMVCYNYRRSHGGAPRPEERVQRTMELRAGAKAKGYRDRWNMFPDPDRGLPDLEPNLVRDIPGAASIAGCQFERLVHPYPVPVGMELLFTALARVEKFEQATDVWDMVTAWGTCEDDDPAVLAELNEQKRKARYEKAHKRKREAIRHAEHHDAMAEFERRQRRGARKRLLLKRSKRLRRMHGF